VGGTTPMALGYLESYDPSLDLWTDLPSMLARVEYPACAVVGQNVYFFGGDDSTGNESGLVQGYDSASTLWGYGTSTGFTPRTKATACFLNGLVYVVGGYNPGVTGNIGGYLRTVEAYDPYGDRWTNPVAPMGIPRANVGMGAVNGILYAFGGIADSGPTSVMQAYDPASNTWSYKTSLPFDGAGDGVVINGILYAFSGVTDSVAAGPGTVYAYDPATDTWTRRCPMPDPRVGFGAVPVGSDVYVIGGSGIGNIFTGETELSVFF